MTDICITVPSVTLDLGLQCLAACSLWVWTRLANKCISTHLAAKAVFQDHMQMSCI